ncbi:hypothetical protein Pint_03066 [Pistacia integerrima]|uniref:Uncharacterized protein n=1 Tax=Pistacia integerrima TaxID=434235 RepID=A0ACC0ZLS7_9ROSI|nr:hypothetical protein Pint_03066 [Pistacia integerrima]
MEMINEPVSPSGQYLNSSAPSLYVYAFLEFEIPIDDLPVMSLIEDLFLSINPRFSSIMVVDESGEKQWKRVEVKLKDHSPSKSNHILKSVPKILSVVSNTVSDFLWSITESTLVEDDQIPIRSGDPGTEFRPITIATINFSIDEMKLWRS